MHIPKISTAVLSLSPFGALVFGSATLPDDQILADSRGVTLHKRGRHGRGKEAVSAVIAHASSDSSLEHEQESRTPRSHYSTPQSRGRHDTMGKTTDTKPSFAEFVFYGTTFYRDSRRLHKNKLRCRFRLSTKDILMITAGCAIATVSVISVACMRSHHDGRSVLERLAAELQVNTSDIAEGILKLADKAPRSLDEAEEDISSITKYEDDSGDEEEFEGDNSVDDETEETRSGRKSQWDFNIDIDSEVEMELLGQNDPNDGRKIEYVDW